MKAYILIAALLVVGAMAFRFLPKAPEARSIGEVASQLKQEFRAQAPVLGDFNISVLKKNRMGPELVGLKPRFRNLQSILIQRFQRSTDMLKPVRVTSLHCG